MSFGLGPVVLVTKYTIFSVRTRSLVERWIKNEQNRVTDEGWEKGD